jgi:hypothetical protein
MSSLTQIDKLEFESLFGMSGGYVLEFTNASFQRFVLDTVKINPYDSKYEIYGDSKANRLRAIWHIESDQKVGILSLKMIEFLRTNKNLKGETFTKNEDAIIRECIKTSNRLLGKEVEDTDTEEDFLKKDFKDISLEKLKLDSSVIDVLENRIKEINKCLKSGASLSTIFMCGSVLEGILLGTALRFQREFNESPLSPKDKKTGKVLQFHDWTLNSLIDVAHDLKLLGLDVKKYSHSLRDFRNYIHPYQQMSSGFNPDKDTAQISWQVLKATISDLSKN